MITNQHMCSECIIIKYSIDYPSRLIESSITTREDFCPIIWDFNQGIDPTISPITWIKGSIRNIPVIYHI